MIETTIDANYETTTTTNVGVQGDVMAGGSIFSSVEKAVLRALLVDPPNEIGSRGEDEKKNPTAKEGEGEGTGEGGAKIPKETLSDEMLFAVPPNLGELCKSQSPTKAPLKSKNPQEYRMQVGLWQAHEDGVTANELKNFNNPKRRSSTLTAIKRASISINAKTEAAKLGNVKDEDEDDDNSEVSADSDGKVLPDRLSARLRESRGVDADDDERSDSSSWAEKDGGFQHFDAWEVLLDDYAKEAGFDFTPDNSFPEDSGDALEGHNFKILGTSAKDIAAHPHVLSPPLIDSILNFVPDGVEYENMWLKYSLIRDGANFDTFKRYVRASSNTIVAIETTKGHVFGSFTSSPWVQHRGLYGGNPSFLWRMRRGRCTPCHSLVEQAQLESEIDVHFLIGDEHLVQFCSSDMLAIGEGEIEQSGGEVISATEKGETHGFAIAITDDLLRGTTSRCDSFKSPCLTDTTSQGEVFDVLNLEVWTFTPCINTDLAEKLEMTQFFVSEESLRSNNSSSRSTQQWSSSDLKQDQFYRRVGYNDPGEDTREQWLYRNMMDGANMGASQRPFGASPRNG